MTHLTGRWTAEEIAKRVSGVRAIANEIQVTPPLSGIRSDTEIAEAAANALSWNVATAASSITPIVNQGWVTLSGKVTWGFQKHAAERLVRTLAGVRHVRSDIIVACNTKMTDFKHRIEEALKCLALHETQWIHVQVDDSTITLSGQEHSLQARSNALEVVSMIPGVEHVENRLDVRS